MTDGGDFFTLTVPSITTYPVGSPGGVFVHLLWLVFLLFEGAIAKSAESNIG